MTVLTVGEQNPLWVSSSGTIDGNSSQKENEK